MDVVRQQAIMDAININPLLPMISKRYKSSLIRYLIKTADGQGHEVIEPLILSLADCLTSLPQDTWTYRTYTYGHKKEDEISLDGYLSSLSRHHRLIASVLDYSPSLITNLSDQSSLHHVTLKVDENMLGGSTGFFAWEAGFAMSEWILNNGDSLVNCNILELGCGLGLTGICLSRTLPIGHRSITLTDGNPEVVASCALNLGLNGLVVGEESGIECRELLWDEISMEQYRKLFKRESGSNRDLVVLASDVLYDPLLFPHLLDLICSLIDLHSQHSEVSDIKILIFTTLRQEESFVEFERQSKVRGLHLESTLIRGTAPIATSMAHLKTLSPPSFAGDYGFIHRLNPAESCSGYEPPIILTCTHHSNLATSHPSF